MVNHARVKMTIGTETFKANGEAGAVLQQMQQFVARKITEATQKAATRAAKYGKSWKHKNRAAGADARPEFERLLQGGGMVLDVAQIKPTGEHWMINYANGKRVADFWPSTMRVSLNYKPAFIVGDPLDAARSALCGFAVGQVAKVPGKPD